MTQGSGSEKSGGNGFLIGGGILLVLLLLFIFQNTADTTFKYLFWDFTLPLWLGLLITADRGVRDRATRAHVATAPAPQGAARREVVRTRAAAG